jgi:hypothetical protein
MDGCQVTALSTARGAPNFHCDLPVNHEGKHRWVAAAGCDAVSANGYSCHLPADHPLPHLGDTEDPSWEPYLGVGKPPIRPRPSTTKVEQGGGWTPVIVTAIIIVAVVALIVAVFLMISKPRDDSASQILTTDTTPPTVWQTTNLPTTLTDAATTTRPAARAEVQIQVTEPPPRPFDPMQYVNSLEYRALVMDQPMEAYRLVAAWYGWPDDVIEARSTFVFRIIANESAGCWNAVRWTYFTAGKLCTDHDTGNHDDAGFFQITSVLRPLTCEKANICSRDATVASPWNSMLAGIVVLDELGKRPWCYQRNMHIRNGDCATWPG